MRADREAVRLVAQALHEEQRGIARRQLEGLAARDEKRLAAGIAVGALGDRGEPHALDAELPEHFARRLELPAPAVDDDEIWLFGKRAFLHGDASRSAVRTGATAPRASSRNRRRASASRS